MFACVDVRSSEAKHRCLQKTMYIYIRWMRERRKERKREMEEPTAVAALVGGPVFSDDEVR